MQLKPKTDTEFPSDRFSVSVSARIRSRYSIALAFEKGSIITKTA